MVTGRLLRILGMGVALAIASGGPGLARASICGDGITEGEEECDSRMRDSRDRDCCTDGCEFRPAGTACRDEIACIERGDCDAAGVCVGGGQYLCSDGNVCTDDLCEVNIGCFFAENAAPCDDGNVCTSMDVCSGGACIPGVNNTDPCSDGDICTDGDVCSGGACIPGLPVVCSDGNVCTDDSCSAGIDCVFMINSAPCNDFAFCNGADTCSGGSCSVHEGNPCVGADGDENCSESCNEGADNCGATDPNGSACDDDDACTNGDTCSGGACFPGPPLVCIDGNVCTNDFCLQASGCFFPVNNDPCNDFTFCNGADFCSGGICNVHLGDPCVGPDGDANCSESCNEGADNCGAADPNGSGCNDADACTASDTCSGGSCLGGPPLVCDDMEVCTSDGCAPGSGCVFTALPDTDGDTVCDAIDNCLFVPNAAQANFDSAPQGDACQCGDVTGGDGRITNHDVRAARENLTNATPTLAFAAKRCNVVGPFNDGVDDCGVDDIYVLQRVVAGGAVAVGNECVAFAPQLGP